MSVSSTCVSERHGCARDVNAKDGFGLEPHPSSLFSLGFAFLRIANAPPLFLLALAFGASFLHSV